MRATELNCVPSSAAVSRMPPGPKFQSAVVSSVNVGVGMPFNRPALHRQAHEELAPHRDLPEARTVAGTKAQINMRRQPCRRSEGDAFRGPSGCRPVHPGGRNKSPNVAAWSDPTARWTQP